MTSQTSLPTPLACRRPSGSAEDDLRAVFAGLSAQSRFLRFHTGVPQVPRAWLPHLARVEPGRVDTALAWIGDLPVGHGQWHATDGPTAELSLAVADDWQRRGVGTALVDHLSVTALRAGITGFTCWVHPHNTPVRTMLRARGARPAGGDCAWSLDLDGVARPEAREAA